MSEPTHHVVIVGAGFGGLETVHRLRGAPVRITVIDRRNHHLFQPLLYQVATASLATSEIAWPIRHLLRKRPEVTTLLASLIGVDKDARLVRLEDGSTIRINYDSYNGYPYTAVGRILIERNIIPKDQMSMQRIRQWMDENPDGAKELRRQNRSYVFFHEVKLSDKDEAIGAQGVPLTPGRSIAVDKSLHVYGTPFFIEGELPIESEQAKTPFHRLMIAQDTGSAILGPARADLYFGAGPEAGRVSGRLRHSMHFVMLVPNSLDPVASGKTMPLPDARPSAKIAKLFPPKTSKPADGKGAPGPVGAPAGESTKSVPTAAEKAASSEVTPLPAARPEVKQGRRHLRRHHYRHRHYRHYRRAR